MKRNNSDTNFVGARKGASGTLDDLKNSPPTPKAWLRPSLVKVVMGHLKANQLVHSRLSLDSIIYSHFFDSSKDRYRIVWSKNMITSAGVSRIQRKGADAELVLHLRDGEEERGDNPRWMRQVLEGLYAKGGLAKESVENFLYLTLVHEASEIHQRKQAETLNPDIKAEIRAELEEAKAYLSYPADRRKALKQLYRILDGTHDAYKKIYSRELDLFESIGEENLGTIEGLLALIEFVLGMPDYAKESKLYHDERTRLQLARSLFVDILHDFASSSKTDRWVRDVESSDAFASQPVKFNYTENSEALSKQAEEIFSSAVRIIAALKGEGSGSESLPGKSQIKRVVDSFNEKIGQLDSIKAQLKLNEVLSIPSQLKDALEDNKLNRHFSYMDKFGIYYSLDLSRIDLRGLNLHSGDDKRTENDRSREINKHKDERADLRGAHFFGSDISERANFNAAQMDFVIASYSNLSEVVFTRTKAIGMVFYGANANEAQFEHAKMTAADARGMSASFARIQMKETDINGMKIWQSDVPSWQRAYVDVFQLKAADKVDDVENVDRESLKEELDFLDDSFLDELKEIDETDTFQREQTWIELREVDGQLDFLKGRGIVFYSRDEVLTYSVSEQS
ncbi:MAG: pentapeptide repeat-containing protein [Gammaproteobacteria bacterium]|nr:pentapeptide repeat-containing protein [Gammaproteobacteria bacterium]